MASGALRRALPQCLFARDELGRHLSIDRTYDWKRVHLPPISRRREWLFKNHLLGVPGYDRVLLLVLRRFDDVLLSNPRLDLSEHPTQLRRFSIRQTASRRKLLADLDGKWRQYISAALTKLVQKYSLQEHVEDAETYYASLAYPLVRRVELHMQQLLRDLFTEAISSYVKSLNERLLRQLPLFDIVIYVSTSSSSSSSSSSSPESAGDGDGVGAEEVYFMPPLAEIVQVIYSIPANLLNEAASSLRTIGDVVVPMSSAPILPMLNIASEENIKSLLADCGEVLQSMVGDVTALSQKFSAAVTKMAEILKGSDLLSFKEFEAEIKNIPDKLNMSLLRVETSKAKEQMLEKSRKRLQEVLDNSCREATKMFQLGAQKFEKGIDLMRNAPPDVEAFAKQRDIIRNPERFCEPILCSHVLPAVAIIDNIHAHQIHVPEDLLRKMFYCRGTLLTEVYSQANVALPELKKYAKPFTSLLFVDRTAFEEKLRKLDESSISIGGMTNLTRVHEYADDIARLEDGLSAASYERERLQKFAALLEVAGTGFEFALVDEMRKNIEPYAKLWEEASAWKSSESRWLRDPFHLLQPEVTRVYLDKMFQQMRAFL